MFRSSAAGPGVLVSKHNNSYLRTASHPRFGKDFRRFVGALKVGSV